MGYSGVIEVADRFSPPVNRYACSPRLLGVAPTYPERGVTNLRLSWTVMVLLVVLRKHVSKVGESVVRRVSVDVIDLVFRPLAVRVEPHNSVDVESLLTKAKAMSPVSPIASDNRTFDNFSPVTARPGENTRCKIAVKDLSNGLRVEFCRKVVHRVATLFVTTLSTFAFTVAPSNAGEIPKNAERYLPLVAAEVKEHWPDAPTVAYAPSLIELESCITPTHKRCWSPTSELRTPREQGLGLGQLTRAWRADGSLRFDALSDARRRFPQLRELSWTTLRDRPDLQIRTLVLMSRDTWEVLRVVSNPWDRLAMTDAAYNGGLGGLQSERRACQIASDCDPQKWFGNVERYCLKSKAALYAGRSPCDINRHHVKDVFRKIPKYQRALRT